MMMGEIKLKINLACILRQKKKKKTQEKGAGQLTSYNHD
jgi:hypothetical protein